MLHVFANSIVLFLIAYLVNINFRCQHAMVSGLVLRLHASACHDLAEMTRNWMNNSVRQHLPLHSHSRHLAHQLGQGRLQLHDLNVTNFFAPDVKYQPSRNTLLYLSTDGGYSEIDAQWSLQSDFLLSMIRSPAFTGNVRAKISGFSADVSIKMVQKNQLSIHQCIARFDEFQLYIGGSLAADLIHWFHRPLAQAMQSHVEETYCQMIEQKLLPWLREQLARLALKLRLHIELGTELQLSQKLHSIRTGEGHLDLIMAQRLSQKNSAGNGKDRLLAEIFPLEMPANKKKGAKEESADQEDEDHRHDVAHSMDFLLPESTLQQLFSGAHVARQLHANFSSPFLRTSCPLLCLGKFVPQMRTALGPAQLLAVLRTNNSPTVQLFRHRIRLKLNMSFELFHHWHINEGNARENAEGNGVGLMSRHNDDANRIEMDADKEEEEEEGEEEGMQEQHLEEIEDDRGQLLSNNEEEAEEGNEIEDYGDEQADIEQHLTRNDNQHEKLEISGEGTLIRPKLVGVNPNNEMAAKRTTNTRSENIAIGTASHANMFVTATTNIISGGKSVLAGDKTFMRTSTKIPAETSIITTTRPWIPSIQREPVLRIVLDTELEISLILDRLKRRLKTELTLTKVRAVLAQSHIRDLSQKTIDLLMEALVPFLENSVNILYRDGLELDNLLDVATHNESIHVEDGFVRYSVDVRLGQLLSSSLHQQ